MTANLDERPRIDEQTAATSGHDATPGHDAVTELSIDDVPAEPRRLTAVRSTVLSWLRALGIDEDRSQDVILATYEALANSVEHAYVGGAEAAPHNVTVHARYAGKSELTVIVEDQGTWMVPDHDPRRGRGIPLIQALADGAEVSSDSTGTVVRMHWNL